MIYDFAHILCSHYLQTERHGWRLDWWCSCEWTWVYSVIAMKLWFTRQPSDTKRIWNVVVLGLKVSWFYIAFYLVVPTQFIIPFILVDCCVWGWVWVVQQASWCVQIFICCHTVHNTWRWLEQIHHHNQNSNNSSGLDISNHSLEETSNKTCSWGVCANVCNPITELGSSGCIAPNFTQMHRKRSTLTWQNILVYFLRLEVHKHTTKQQPSWIILNWGPQDVYIYQTSPKGALEEMLSIHHRIG